MKFPCLELSEEELSNQRIIEDELVGKIKSFFVNNYDINNEVKCTGSTEKGTALPEEYFGTDFDVSIHADKELLDRVAYTSDKFEGCQLFSIDFFKRFSEEFENVYFAGHRVSGEINGRKFDFSTTDKEKDAWKWEYNNSKYLNTSEDLKKEIKKTKFFLKNFNVYGSEMYGIVGPAVELGLYEKGSFDAFKKAISTLSFMESSLKHSFATSSFPEEFYNLFGESHDHIHEGIVKSFKFAAPNTFNRLVDVSKNDFNSYKEFVENKFGNVSFERQLSFDNNRFLLYMLNIMIEENDKYSIEIERNKEGIKVYSNVVSNNSIGDVCDSIEALYKEKEFNVNNIPSEMVFDLEKKCPGKELSDYIFFIGSPNSPMSSSKTYIPFDFLVRGDANKLISVMEEGQNGTR